MDDRPLSRVESVAAHVRERIATRALMRGARLPSVRDLSQKLGVSKSTVVEAYERLAAEGAVAARRGSGFFVAGAARPLALRMADPPPEPAIDPFWINRHAMMGAADFLCPGAGWLPDSWVLDLGVQRALRVAARSDSGRRRQYDEPLGFPPLRRLFALRLAERSAPGRSRPGDRHRFLLAGARSRLPLPFSPGDTAVVDDPCYFNFLSLLKASRAKSSQRPFSRTDRTSRRSSASSSRIARAST